MSTYKNYVVREGDTLWSIAKKELSCAAQYAEIVATNRLKTATLPEGMVLQMPTNGGTREG
jgi:nucleoid-associated protein YgaU